MKKIFLRATYSKTQTLIPSLITTSGVAVGVALVVPVLFGGSFTQIKFGVHGVCVHTHLFPLPPPFFYSSLKLGNRHAFWNRKRTNMGRVVASFSTFALILKESTFGFVSLIVEVNH